MSFGLPLHLAPHSLARAISRAFHVGAAVHLGAAALAVSAVQATAPDLRVWPAALALIPVAALLFLLSRRRTPLLVAGYLAVGSACTYWYTSTLFGVPGFAAESNRYIVAMPTIALMLSGTVQGRPFSALVTSATGFVVGCAATLFAGLRAGWRPDAGGAPLIVLAVLIATSIALGMAGNRPRSAAPNLMRAERDEALYSLRYRIELKAAALMHDTVLNHLSAVAVSKEGQLPPGLKTQIERDLEVLIGEEWLSEPSQTVDASARADWQSSELFAAIEESRHNGLQVEVSGDLAAIGRIDRARARVLGLAVKQCLVNVLKHAGTDRAEVVVYGSEQDLTVMVIDAGKGFRVEQTRSDRLGLRASVVNRVESLGGKVQVWSTPGRGTSVMIRIPAPQSDDPAGESADAAEAR